MGMIFDDLEDHEGYAARRPPDATLAAAWTLDTDVFDADVGACSCGWTGTDAYPPTENGRTAAEDHWEHAHAQPLLETEVPVRISELVDNLRGDSGARRPPASRRPSRRRATGRVVRARQATDGARRTATAT
jgi:hypothetical protein